MRISLVSTRAGLKDLQQSYQTAVVLDILRATTTITTALANGCRGVIAVAEVEEARALAAAKGKVLLGGERGAVRLPGFHLGNSPLEYTADKVGGKTVVLTTTNGTGTIELAVQRAAHVLMGSLLNVRAVAQELAAFKGHILLACAGTRGKFSLEDTLAAGWIIKELLEIKGVKEYRGRSLAPRRRLTNSVYQEETPLDSNCQDLIILDDMAVAAYRLAIYYNDNTLDALYDSLHGQKLVQLGMTDDLIYCSQLNTYSLVPKYKDGVIVT
ncbi:2-phosphosulfolactate phosphatase [Desulfofalx alkaliphila]|uniref:2-phosphosulfolactate phosphatase n=1 Tax=Desulfofalx alkaliphila TaxID=105483 RepID=UPI0004E26028|nr:2-phosphosulfolactate phosphatase [Desulfofalx alkaliphila]